MEYILTRLVAIAATVLIMSGLWLAGEGAGPNCPGMDPQWIGWCK